MLVKRLPYTGHKAEGIVVFKNLPYLLLILLISACGPADRTFVNVTNATNPTQTEPSSVPASQGYTIGITSPFLNQDELGSGFPNSLSIKITALEDLSISEIDFQVSQSEVILGESYLFEDISEGGNFRLIQLNNDGTLTDGVGRLRITLDRELVVRKDDQVTLRLSNQINSANIDSFLQVTLVNIVGSLLSGPELEELPTSQTVTGPALFVSLGVDIDTSNTPTAISANSTFRTIELRLSANRDLTISNFPFQIEKSPGTDVRVAELQDENGNILNTVDLLLQNGFSTQTEFENAQFIFCDLAVGNFTMLRGEVRRISVILTVNNLPVGGTVQTTSQSLLGEGRQLSNKFITGLLQQRTN